VAQTLSVNGSRAGRDGHWHVPQVVPSAWLVMSEIQKSSQATVQHLLSGSLSQVHF
jgi:hypothetical protein